MAPIITTAEIARPAAEVFACATDPTRFSEWQKGVVDGHMDSGTGTLAVGAKCVTTRRIGGASRPSTSELVDIDPPRTWSVRGTDGPIRRQEGNAMTENHDRPVPRRDDLQLLLEDLACVCGTLSEIMTAWRRAQPGRPDLQPGQLVGLEDDARQLTADLEAAAKGTQASWPAGRLAALAEEAAAVRAVTGAPGCVEAGDRSLWELLAAAIRRAQARLPAPAPVPVTISSPAGRPQVSMPLFPNEAGTRPAAAVSCGESGASAQGPPGGG